MEHFLEYLRGKISPPSHLVIEGQTVKFSCESNDEVQWYFNNQILVKNNSNIVEKNNELEIAATYLSAGEYKCYGQTNTYKNYNLNTVYFYDVAHLTVLSM